MLRWSRDSGSVAAQIHHLGLRRVAQAGIGTALEAHLDLAAGTGRDLQFQALAIDLLLAEKLVAVASPCGNAGFCSAGKPSNFRRF